MARSVSDEEIVLKKRARRRLIGAIALVTLVVVLLPMFLDSDPRPLNQEINIQIPDQSTQFSSRVATVPPAPGGATAGSGSKTPESSKPVSRETEKPTAEAETKAAELEKSALEQERRAAEERAARAESAQKPESKPAPKPESKPAPKPEPKTAAKPEQKATVKPEPKPEPKATAESPREKETGGEGFIVQVAALTDVDKAKALRGKIAESGLRAYTEVIRTAKGEVTRVRVGPFASREAAQKATEELKKLGLSGVVAPRG